MISVEAVLALVLLLSVLQFYVILTTDTFIREADNALRERTWFVAHSVASQLTEIQYLKANGIRRTTLVIPPLRTPGISLTQCTVSSSGGWVSVDVWGIDHKGNPHHHMATVPTGYPLDINTHCSQNERVIEV